MLPLVGCCGDYCRCYSDSPVLLLIVITTGYGEFTVIFTEPALRCPGYRCCGRLFVRYVYVYYGCCAATIPLCLPDTLLVTPHYVVGRSRLLVTRLPVRTLITLTFARRCYPYGCTLPRLPVATTAPVVGMLPLDLLCQRC